MRFAEIVIFPNSANIGRLSSRQFSVEDIESSDDAIFSAYSRIAEAHVNRSRGKSPKSAVMRALVIVLALSTFVRAGKADAACTVPNQISNGQTADATVVMGNFNALKSCVDSVVAPSGTPVAGQLSVFSSPNTVTSGDLSGDVTTSGSTAATLAPSGVTPGTYTRATITVDAKGRVTSASSGVAGDGGSWVPAAPLAADFSTVRVGTGMTSPTITDVSVGAGVQITFTRNAASSNWQQAYILKAAPGVPFRAEALIVNPRQSTNNWFSAGLAIGSTNPADVARHLSISDFVDGNKKFPYSHRNTGLNAQETSFTTITGATNLDTLDSKFWMAIEWDGTNIRTYASFDGYTWWVHGVEPAGFFTGAPDLVGFSWEAVGSDGGIQYVWCPHFYITTNLNEPLGLNRR